MKPASSYLYIGVTSKVYSVGDLLGITYNTVNGAGAGFIYYMVRLMRHLVWFKKAEQQFAMMKHFVLSLLQVLSRGILIQNGSLPFGTSIKQNLQITANMVPSFRLIGYFYNQEGDVIADSVWVDVRDECEIKVKVGKHD